MCGVVGYSSRSVTKRDLSKLRQVLIESRIRGMHASGIAWFDGKRIQCCSDSVPIDTLLESFDLNQLLYRNGRVSMIAHARYSTSSLKYNQPLVGEHIAIAHNGVISQASAKEWYGLYGYQCITKNDSELLLRAIEKGDNPLRVFPDASIAAVTLDDQGNVEYIRNKRRPLWVGRIGAGTVVASTFDILHRAGVSDIQKVAVAKDLQVRSMEQWET